MENVRLLAAIWISWRSVLWAFLKTFLTFYILHKCKIKIQWFMCNLTLFKHVPLQIMSSMVIHFHHSHVPSDSSHLSTVHCDKKAIELSEKHTVCFSKIEASSGRWLCLKNETPGINRSTFLQLWPFQTRLKKIHEKTCPLLFTYHTKKQLLPT